MRNLFIIIFFLTPIITFGQEKSIVSDLENLELNIGDSFTPSTFVVDLQNNRSDCERMIYYNKRGVFSTANSITVDNQSGTITANKPGSHEVVAVVLGQIKKELVELFRLM
jgi:stress response protein SCP2